MPTGRRFPGARVALLALRTAIHDPPRFLLGRFTTHAGTRDEAHEELPVPFGAAQRRLRDGEDAEPESGVALRADGETVREPYHLDERRELLGRVADDPALAHLAPADFELGLHERHDRGLARGVRARGEPGN